MESALFPEGLAPALAPEPAALPAVAGMPSIGVCPLPSAFFLGSLSAAAAVETAR